MRFMMLFGMRRVTFHFAIAVICSSLTIYLWLWPLAKGGDGDPFFGVLFGRSQLCHSPSTFAAMCAGCRRR